MRKYESGSGTTRTVQSDELGAEPSLRYAAISGPEAASAPGQKGQSPSATGRGLGRTRTHCPRVGSFLSSSRRGLR